MKYITMTLAYLAIFALMLASAAFGAVVRATDGAPAPDIAPAVEQPSEEGGAEAGSPEQLINEHYENDDRDDAYYVEAPAIELELAFDNAFKQWEISGYPDDIGGVYYDSDLGKMGILIVNPEQGRIDELRAMFSDGVVLTPSTFSYNELRLAQEEIDAIMAPGSGIYSTGVGWTSTDGIVHGFGESGKEFRLVVGVDESVFDHYSEGFAALYGDRVVIEASSQVALDSISESGGLLDGGMVDNGGGDALASRPIAPIVPVDISAALSGSAFFPPTYANPDNGIWLWAILGVGLAGILLLLLRLRPRPVHAMQTADGGVVVGSSAVSKKQVVDAIRNSAIAPSDGLFDRVSEQIDSQGAYPTHKTV